MKNGVCRPPSSFVNTYASALNFVCGVIDAGLASTCPRSTSSFSVPRSSSPTLSPAMPSSSSFRNISIPVTTRFIVGRKPTISTSSPTFTLPRSTRPVTTVPRPEIEKISSIGIANGLSTSRTGCGMYLVHRFHQRINLSFPTSLPRSMPRAPSLGSPEYRPQETGTASRVRVLPVPPVPAVPDLPPRRTCS